MNRRQFFHAAAGAVAPTVGMLGMQPTWHGNSSSAAAFEFRYLLASCMYGTMRLKEILPEVKKIGATAIDIWPMPHGNQREQLSAMGVDAFCEQLELHQVEIGCLTQYPLGPFGLTKEIELAGKLNCHTIVTGGAGPKGLAGADLKNAVAAFAKKLKPHLEHARQHGVTIAIENHANNLIFSHDSLKWLAEFTERENLGIALAPYHLEQEAHSIARLIKSLGDRVKVFYAWQHGLGCSKKLPKEEELLQLPGRGDLDFGPIVKALVETDYRGWTTVFMHPVPRGIPILPTTKQVTAEINRAKAYLEGLAPAKK